MNVYEKLQKCRVDLQNLKCVKSGKNLHTGFDYYMLDDFIPSVNNLFNIVKLTSSFVITYFNETPMAVLKIINCEKPDEIIEFTSPIADAQLRGCTPIQSLGAVNTYMKRYLYLNALEIVEPDSIDAAVGNKELIPDATKDAARGIEVSQVKVLRKQKPEILDVVCKTYGVSSIEALCYDDAKNVIAGLKAKGNLVE